MLENYEQKSLPASCRYPDRCKMAMIYRNYKTSKF